MFLSRGCLHPLSNHSDEHRTPVKGQEAGQSRFCKTRSGQKTKGLLARFRRCEIDRQSKGGGRVKSLQSPVFPDPSPSDWGIFFVRMKISNSGQFSAPRSGDMRGSGRSRRTGTSRSEKPPFDVQARQYARLRRRVIWVSIAPKCCTIFPTFLPFVTRQQRVRNCTENTQRAALGELLKARLSNEINRLDVTGRIFCYLYCY